ncbi:helicase-exonuclease AddAB subunit AddB [Paenibacillus sp. JNUCC31]|uniref:helicase-exonuclease AddAB subunit AddB n=1 Tax=Paenibacillus sp. JNUCC-31 TaxID=2777983 RepID=UPI00178345F3|nr:helicase-exonuclease AddAB subunit AddB [Paenibacillus sp. JNUCC-31]QOS80298.1 helicase-exonuclease AddAB subunit AddB [Paenibacillus sp. JNUCC-31]
MSVRFIIGRAGSGKSALITQEITSLLQKEPQGKPLILLVPEQSTFRTEQSLVSSGAVKGTVRAEVLGFRRLAYRVMQEAGGSARIPIGAEGKKMLLYKVLQRRKEELKLFGASGSQLGFIGDLNDLYSEFKRYELNPTSLEEGFSAWNTSSSSAPILGEKLHDLLLIYRDYEKELTGLYIDDEDTLTELTERLSESALLQDAQIWIDGFQGFTPQEMSVIGRLMMQASSVTITLTLDRAYDHGALPEELELFHPTASAYTRLKGMAEDLGVLHETTVLQPEVLPRFEGSPGLAHLEAGFDRRVRWKSEGRDAGVRIYAAENRRAEMEGALREMRRLAQDEGARYRDMAVLVRQLDTYADIAEPLFRDYDVPVFLDRRRNELHHPLSEFIRSALDIVRRRWRYEDVFRCVKTDLLLPRDGSITREDMDQLENYILACGIHGYRWTDGKPWKYVPSLSLEDNGQEGPSRGREQMLSLMEKCRSVIVDPLGAFEKRMLKAKTAKDQCAALFRLLEDAEIPWKLDHMSAEAKGQGDPERSREHRQMWGAVLDLLDQMVDMMGAERLDMDLFAGLMETGLTELKLGLVPPALDQVLVGSMDRTRLQDIKYVFILGAVDGELPAVPQDDGVLTEQERQLLTERGLGLGPGATRQMLDERFLIYTALTAASKQLWLSYPVADDEGKALLPSEIVRHIRKMFGLHEQPLLAQPPVAGSEESHWSYIIHSGQSLSYLIGQLRRWRRGEDIPEMWWAVYNWHVSRETSRPQLEQLLGSIFYRNRALPLRTATSRRLYGTEVRTSVSRMERFVACPFSHFASHGLRLKERQLYRLQAPDIGQLFHAALSQLAIRLREENRSWGSLSPEECRKEAEHTVEQIAPQLQGEILLSTKRYGYIFRKLKDIVSRASVILGEQSRRGSFEPIGLELDFGPDKPLPPLRFELENGCVMEIVGRIDRVDVAEGENGLLLRVIDYKSSQTDLKLHEVYYGLSLQMLTYLEVLLSAAEEWLGESAMPGGTLYFHVHNPLLQSANGMTSEQAGQELLKRFKMKGLLLADRDAIAQMDNTLDKGYSAIIPVALKADGSFYSSAAVATPEQWDTLLASVRSNIREIGTRITDGDVAIEPYRIQQEVACTFCPYKSVCQFDETIEGNEYNLLSKPGKQQIWDMLSHQKGGENS